jgi:hypothetical protein
MIVGSFLVPRNRSPIVLVLALGRSDSALRNAFVNTSETDSGEYFFAPSAFARSALGSRDKSAFTKSSVSGNATR